MKKKVIKKKTSTKKDVVSASDDVEMPMARIDNDGDVAEDYKVMDMSDIAAPVIEFVLPNLGEKEVENQQEEVEDTVVEEEKTVKKKSTAKKSAKEVGTKANGKKDPLTAEKLNNELVRMRTTVVKAKARLMGKLVRQKKQLEAKSQGKNKEEVQRKLVRLGEEIVGLKKIDKDAVAKFAALNTKTLEELKIDGKTPADERIMYKLACQDLVVQAVNSFKDKYIEWNKTAAFFMQRLGLQYSNKTEKEAEKKEETEAEDDSEPKDASDAGSTDGEDDDEYNESDVEMVDSDGEAGVEVAQKRRNLLLGLIGVAEDKTRPALKPKKRKIEDDDVDLKTKRSEKPESTQQDSESKKAMQPKQVKRAKKGVVPTKKGAAAARNVEKEELEEDVEMEEDSSQKTLVLKIDLSKGGKIEASKTKAPVVQRKDPPPITADDANDSDDESAAFFLPKTTPVSGKNKTIPSKKNAVGVKGKKKEFVPEKKLEVEQAPLVTKKKGSSKMKVASEEVHPSWAASQQKKKEMQAAKPCGKKITFADDD